MEKDLQDEDNGGYAFWFRKHRRIHLNSIWKFAVESTIIFLDYEG